MHKGWTAAPYLLFLTAAIAAPCGAVVAASGSGYDLRTLALLGDPAPGGGQFEYGFEPYGLNAKGEIAFGADVSPGGQAVFIGDAAGGFKLVARAGDPAPGGRVFGQLLSGLISQNESGDLAFLFSLEDCGALCAGLFRFRRAEGSLEALAVPEQPSPDGGHFEAACGHPSMDDLGRVAFPAFVSGAPRPHGGEARAIFDAAPDGQLSLLVYPGDAVQGGPTLEFTADPWIAGTGDVAFTGYLTQEVCIPGNSCTSCLTSVFLRRASGEIIPVALQGQAAPGGGAFRAALAAVLNERGEIAFLGDLGEEAAPDSPAYEVFLYRGGELLPVARLGIELPGGGKLVTASRAAGGLHLNDAGEIAFSATLDTFQDRDGNGRLDVPEQGLYIWDEGKIRLVARSGTDAPGGGSIIAFLPPALLAAYPSQYPWPFPALASNEVGQVLFSAVVRGSNGNLAGALVIAAPGVTCFRRGDANGDGSHDISDPVAILNALFLAGPTACADAQDANDDGGLDVSDVVYDIQAQFLGGPDPPAPGPDLCGPDPTGDALDCEDYVE